MEGLSDPTIGQAADKFEAMITESEGGTPPEEQPVEEEVSEEEVSEATTEEEVAEEPKEEAEEEASEEDAGEEDSTSDDEIGQWLSEVQESLQDNPELLDSLQLNVKVNGEEQEVSFAELKKAQMQEADYTRKTQALAEQKKELEKNQMEKDQQLEATIAQFTNSAQVQEQQLQAQYNSPELAELRVTDPAEWTARRSELESAYQAIQAQKQQALSNYQTYKQNQLAKQYNDAVEVLVQEIPEWKDEAHRNNDLQALRELALGYGMDDNFINTSTHPGLIRALRDAQAHRNTQNIVATKGKKVLKSVKNYIKPGKKPATNTSAVGRQTKARGKLKKTGTLKDAARAFEQFL